MLNNEQKILRKRIIEISHKNHLSHIGSCLNVVDLIDQTYKIKNKEDHFILSSGHSAVALFVVLEKYGKNIREDKNFYIHPDRLANKEIEVSTGSLGQGLPIAVGIALADPRCEVFCLVSDGECAEGSIWESFRIINDKNINNLTILLTANGFGAYDSINTKKLKSRISSFGFKVIEVDGHDPSNIKRALRTKHKVPLLIFANTSSEQLPFLKGQNAHYYIMKNDFDIAMDSLS